MGGMRIHLALPIAALALAAPATDAGDGSADGDRPSGTLVIVAGDEQHLTAVDLATGRVRRLHARWLGVCAPPPFMTGGMLVGQGQTRTGGHGYTFALDPRLHGRPRNLGRSWYAIPSATDGRVWLAGMPHRNSDRLSALREVTVGGRTTFVSRRRQPNWNITGAVGRGLVFGLSRRLVVWDPRTGRVQRRIRGASPVAMRGNRLAWCGHAACRLAIRITNVRTGRLTLARAPRPWRIAGSGTFSPDAQRLAAPVWMGRRQRALAVADAASGRMTIIPGSRLAEGYPPLTWSADGEWLIWSAGRDGLRAWRAGSAAPLKLGVRAPRALALATGW
jgi:hypothetical protein